MIHFGIYIVTTTFAIVVVVVVVSNSIVRVLFRTKESIVRKRSSKAYLRARSLHVIDRKDTTGNAVAGDTAMITSKILGYQREIF